MSKNIKKYTGTCINASSEEIFSPKAIFSFIQMLQQLA